MYNSSLSGLEESKKDEPSQPWVIPLDKVLLYSLPESNVKITFRMPSDVVSNEELVIAGEFDVQVRGCELGEYFLTQNPYQPTCKNCAGDTYVLNPFAKCVPCPKPHNCTDGVIRLKENFWRHDEYSDIINYCLPTDILKCKGAFPGNECVDGYVGPFCQNCDRSNGFTSFGT